MNNFIKNILLLAVALVLSYLTAPYFGSIYNQMFPTELNSGWIGSSQSLEFIRGISLSLIPLLTIFTIFIFKKKSSVLWLISPLLLWEIIVDVRHIYIPVTLALIALGLATFLRKIFKIGKFTEPSPR